MNIFVLDLSPVLAAQYQCNKHVVKMILESAQLLSSARIVNGFPAPYKSTHVNHPCAVWARESRQNYEWLHDHMVALLNEYESRYNKIHKVRRDGLEYLLGRALFLPSLGLTPFALAMPEEFSEHQDDPVECYREYYRYAKADMARWPEHKTPWWWAQ
jgi:hypothetical protein